MLTAAALRREGAEVVVVEADRIGGGQTAGTTAKLTAQHGLKYHQLIQTLGAEAAGQYARANLAAVERLRRWYGSGPLSVTFRTARRFCTPWAPPVRWRKSTTPVLPWAWMSFSPVTQSPFAAQALGLRTGLLPPPSWLLAAWPRG